MACVGSTPGFHPLRVPSSVAKMNKAGAEAPSFETLKSLEPLKTIPVGEPVPLPEAVGIATSKGTFDPSALYRVDSPVTLSLTQKGEPGPKVSPQALTRCASGRLVQCPALLATRLVTLYCARAAPCRKSITTTNAAARVKLRACERCITESPL